MTASNEHLRETLEARGIRDARVLDAFRQIPRHEFVAPADRARAYADIPLPIPHGQVTTQPSLIANMIEALAPRQTDAVLEVGTGYGFQTALLAKLARLVWSVERWPDLAETAKASLRRCGVENAHITIGDGTLGLPRHAPFDAIVVAAAFTRVPGPLSQQLKVGGRLVQPIGPGGREDVALYVRDESALRRAAIVTKAHFVRLVGEHAFTEG